jgi:alkylhydroperoxidase family enzyme
VVANHRSKCFISALPACATDGAAKHYDEEQLAALVMLIGLINASTRMGVITRLQGGDYQPGQFG